MNNELAQAIASQKDAILYELFKAHVYTQKCAILVLAGTQRKAVKK